MTTEAIDFDERVDILEMLMAESLQPVVRCQATSRLWAEEDFPRFGQTGETGRQVGDGATGRKRLPCPMHTLKTRRTDQGDIPGLLLGWLLQMAHERLPIIGRGVEGLQLHLEASVL